MTPFGDTEVVAWTPLSRQGTELAGQTQPYPV